MRDGQLAEISFSTLTLPAVGMIFGLTGEVRFGGRSGHPDQVVRVLEVYEPLLEVEAAILQIFRGEATQERASPPPPTTPGPSSSDAFCLPSRACL